MDVILLKDVDKVGLRGEVVSVARGYMRNYLQPRRLAELATPARVAELERRGTERARHEARTVEQAEQVAETLRKTVLRFEVNAGETGTLFGSVTSTDVADEIWRARRIRVDRRKIELHEPIKRIGRYQVPIALFEDVRVEVTTHVVPIGGELPPEEELEAMAAAEAAAAEPEADGEPEASAEAEAEPVADAEPEPEPEASAEAEPAPEASAEAEPAPEASAEAEPEPVADAEPEIEAVAEPEPDASTEAAAEPESESDPAADDK